MQSKELIGIWKSDPDDEMTQKIYGSVTMEFKDNSVLIYKIISGYKEQIIKMKYEVTGDKLITDQPSHPKKEITNFKIMYNKLILFFEDTESVFLKAY